MDISFEQRQLLNSLYRYGYIGNWYKSPNKIFLKVYLADEEKDVHIRIQFDIRLNVIDMTFDDPTVPLFHKSDFENKFSSIIQAIKDAVPKAFEGYAIPIKDMQNFEFKNPYPIELKLPCLMKAEVNHSTKKGCYQFTIFNADGSFHDSFTWSSDGGNHVTMGPAQIWAIDAFLDVYHKL